MQEVWTLQHRAAQLSREIVKNVNKRNKKCDKLVSGENSLVKLSVKTEACFLMTRTTCSSDDLPR